MDSLRGLPFSTTQQRPGPKLTAVLQPTGIKVDFAAISPRIAFPPSVCILVNIGFLSRGFVDIMFGLGRTHYEQLIVVRRHELIVLADRLPMKTTFGRAQPCGPPILHKDT